jgi:hypothetical protein
MFRQHVGAITLAPTNPRPGGRLLSRAYCDKRWFKGQRCKGLTDDADRPVGVDGRDDCEATTEVSEYVAESVGLDACRPIPRETPRSGSIHYLRRPADRINGMTASPKNLVSSL